MEKYMGFELQNVLEITSIVSIFYFKSPKNHYFKGESHNFWELVYIDRGRVLITAGDRKYVINAGEMVFHKPEEFHAISAHDSTSSNFSIISFKTESPAMKFFFDKIISPNSYERDMLRSALSEGSLIFGDIDRCKTLHRTEDAPFGAEQILKSSVENMLISMIRRGAGEHVSIRVESYAQKKAKSEIAARVKAYLEEHVSEKVRLCDIAEELMCSVPQIKKLFREDTGRGIIDYFIDLKLSEVKRLIREGNNNFTQIAMMMGYENLHYLSRLFKLRNDMTLTEYARSLW